MILAEFAAVLAGIGVVQAAAGAVLVARFAAAGPSPAERELRHVAGEGDWRPPITILKPLYGDEPLLEQALGSVCAQGYPRFQVVFGVQDAADLALPVVARSGRSFRISTSPWWWTRRGMAATARSAT